ncbi:MAG: HAMP domain-containing histidine kinase [Bacteroidetes bacterium]|nr:HAMP domain-containing histidine kinase [Bacteroidota bacterium]
MYKPINKIILVIVVVVSLPAIIFSVSEINSLNENERIIENIYNKQLNSVLFTIDQSIYDFVNDWAQKINLLVVNSSGIDNASARKEILQFINLNPQIRMVILADEKFPQTIKLFAVNKDSVYKEIGLSLNDKLVANESKIKRFLSDNQNGYRKIESLDLDSYHKSELFLFSLNLTKDKNDFGGILIDPVVFVQKTLAPKILDITHNEFIITITEENSNHIIFTTGGNNSKEPQQKEGLELLPQFSIGISLEGQTIAGLVKERAIRNLFLIIGVDFIFILGIWFVIRNILKEIELAKIKADFVSNVSHELRTPLSLISLFAETLMLGRIKSAEKEKEYYTIIHQESGRLSRIVDKILHFQSIDEHIRKYKFENININSVIEKVLNTYSYHLKQSGFSYNLNLDGSIPLIFADAEAIAEAIINLIDNAMKYSKENKLIEIQTEYDENFVFINVKDYGIGISVKNQKKIFDKFYRIQNGLVHNTKGAGLGLTIVKDIMDEHKGEVIIDSKEGLGSNFTLKFRINHNV